MIESGSVYLVVRDFTKSVEFYRKLLEKEAATQNKTRFVIFHAGSLCLCLLNGNYDAEHPEQVEKAGEYHPLFDDFVAVTESPNSRKAVINLVTFDLKGEYERVKGLGICTDLTKIRYINAGTPYWYFCLCDPDGNVIEITGDYVPVQGQ